MYLSTVHLYPSKVPLYPSKTPAVSIHGSLVFKACGLVFSLSCIVQWMQSYETHLSHFSLPLSGWLSVCLTHLSLPLPSWLSVCLIFLCNCLAGCQCVSLFSATVWLVVSVSHFSLPLPGWLSVCLPHLSLPLSGWLSVCLTFLCHCPAGCQCVSLFSATVWLVVSVSDSLFSALCALMCVFHLNG